MFSAKKPVEVIVKNVDCEGHKKSTAVKHLPTAEIISAHNVPDIWINKQRGLCERHSALLNAWCDSFQLVAAKNTNICGMRIAPIKHLCPVGTKRVHLARGETKTRPEM